MATRISRRALLTNSAAAGIMGAAMAGVGVAAADEPQGNEEIKTYPTQVHTTDVLVIGSGIGGFIKGNHVEKNGTRQVGQGLSA